MTDRSRLRDFIVGFGALVATETDEAELLRRGAKLLAALVAVDNWLDSDYRRPSRDGYQQYLLHCDSLERFSVVSFVWVGDQMTPIHDHTVWGLVGLLQGGEVSQRFVYCGGALLPDGERKRLRAGDIETISPAIGDLHQVSNDFAGGTTVSIHVYGATIGRVRRSAYRTDGQKRPFVSGYSNGSLPNFWALASDKTTLQ
jgi:predicted metal-dependent enzyme (double-stranded beta helix superfamily)